MSHNDEEYNDSIMLSESLERIAAQAMHLKGKIEAGLQLPSWAEYKVYQAYDAVNKALGTAYPGRYEMEDKKASVFDLVKQAERSFSYNVGRLGALSMGVHGHEAALAGALGGAALGGLTGHLTRKSDDETHRRALGGAAAGAAVGGLGLPAIRQAIRDRTFIRALQSARTPGHEVTNFNPRIRSGITPRERARVLAAVNKQASVFDAVKEAKLVAMTYDPTNPNISALQSQHGANWKKALAARSGISEDAITPITRAGMGAQNKVAFADPTRGTQKRQGPKRVPGAMY